MAHNMDQQFQGAHANLIKKMWRILANFPKFILKINMVLHKVHEMLNEEGMNIAARVSLHKNGLENNEEGINPQNANLYLIDHMTDQFEYLIVAAGIIQMKWISLLNIWKSNLMLLILYTLLLPPFLLDSCLKSCYTYVLRICSLVIDWSTSSWYMIIAFTFVIQWTQSDIQIKNLRLITDDWIEELQ